MSSDDPIDPLEFFNSLNQKKDAQVAPDPTAFPGKTAPKNRGKTHKQAHVLLDTLPFQEYLVGGVAQRFYTIGALAQALNRKPVTIRSWESKGWIPSASFRTPPPRKEQIPGKSVKGKRLYSEAQVVFLMEAAVAYGLSDPVPDWAGFRSHIKTNYPNH